jgi:CRP-like cAMP-binding protein
MIFVPKDIFYELQETQEEFSVRMMVSFLDEFDNIVDKLVDILSERVRRRTGKVLLDLVKNHGFEEDKKTIAITLSRQDLAHLIATNVETLVRTLSDFKEEKIISITGKKISVINLKKLNEVVSLP